MRPYFVRAALRSKAKLEAHYNAAPVEVRNRLNARAYPGQSVEPAAWHPPAGGTQDQARRSDPYGEYVAALQVKYAEWYAALFKLEIESSKWQQRLLDVSDQTVLLSAASRASFSAYSRSDLKPTGSEGEFDGNLLTALGLGGLSSDEQMSLKSACVSIDPVMASVQNPNYLGQLWHWPLDCLAEFSFGLELVLISIFFAPIAAWLGTGDLQAKKQIHTLTSRFGAAVRGLKRSKRVADVQQRVRHMYVAGLTVLERTMSGAATRLAAMARTAGPGRSG